ncbi:alpha/beta fold hydrolase [Hahella sp. SMD15-11]|uniref:Alpha/beta fold hydrolase n=1 Tax=Thermohahella caldifontis TaxID=3142973 RepID=A0AB39USU1_9GAMM
MLSGHLWLLHGQLQRPDVWSALLFPPGWRTHPVDLWSRPWQGFDDLSEWLAEAVSDAGAGPHVLLGYSMGGRLALHALTRQPERWQAAVIVAAHPGPESGRDREQAARFDTHWANRFRHEPPDAVLDDWYRLPVFAGRPPAHRFALKDTPAERVAAMFEVFSKARQPWLLPALGRLRLPIHYITGSLDRPYTDWGKRLGHALPTLTHHVIPDAGHRVPWEQPQRFMTCLTTILEGIPL